MDQMVGTTLSHYRITGLIGQGGMGVVYRADDLVLGRAVALKLLPAQIARSDQERARLMREAQAASAIDHPHVCTVYEVGESADGVLFIAMALYDGRSLSARVAEGPLPLEEAITLTLQAADGLAAAHERGIVHGDIKSDNIMVTARGQVKIMDFGLAHRASVPRLTAAGTTLGTLPYMSPEQARGEALDARTDVWSLGVVLYEMLAGRLPFWSDYADALIYSILHEEPPALAALRAEVPARLEQVVAKALAKEPGARYQTMAELRADLQRCASGGDAAHAETGAGAPKAQKGQQGARRARVRWLRRAGLGAAVLLGAAALWLLLGRHDSPPRTSMAIVVLPFQNFSASPEDAYLSDGMTESIITDVARVHGLLVIARNSAFRYRGQAVDVQRVARELGVGYVLEGSLQRLGGTVRVNAQLIDAATGFHLWADRYDRDAHDLLAVQDEIAARIVAGLRVALSAGDASALHRRPTRDPEAYDAHLRGLFFMNAVDRGAAADSAIVWFERAVARDPEFALAYAHLGMAYSSLFFNQRPDPAYQQKAFVAIERAIALDSTLAEAYVARGNLLWSRANNFPHEQAMGEFTHAVALNANLASAREGRGAVYFHIGLFDRALEELRSAMTLDPLSAFSAPRIARILWYRQQYDSALAMFERTPAPNWKREQAVVLHDLGRGEEALALLLRDAGGVLDSLGADEASAAAMIYAQRGDRKRAGQCIARAYARGHAVSHFHHAEFNIACAYALLGDREAAVEWLRRTAEDGLPCYPLFVNDPNLRGLRDDPGYQALVETLRQRWVYYQSAL